MSRSAILLLILTGVRRRGWRGISLTDQIGLNQENQESLGLRLRSQIACMGLFTAPPLLACLLLLTACLMPHAEMSPCANLIAAAHPGEFGLSGRRPHFCMISTDHHATACAVIESYEE